MVTVSTIEASNTDGSDTPPWMWALVGECRHYRPFLVTHDEARWQRHFDAGRTHTTETPEPLALSIHAYRVHHSSLEDNWPPAYAAWRAIRTHFEIVQMGFKLHATAKAILMAVHDPSWEQVARDARDTILFGLENFQRAAEQYLASSNEATSSAANTLWFL